MDIGAAVERIATELRELGKPERVESERAYLKSSALHYGTSVPDMRTVVGRFLKANPALDHDDVVALCTRLWAQPVHEHRMAAVEMLASSQRVLVSTDMV